MLMLMIVQDIDGLVLVAPAITVFSADLRAKAATASGYAQRCPVCCLQHYL